MDVQSLKGKECPNCGGRLEWREANVNGATVRRVVCVRSGTVPNECRPYYARGR